MFRSIEDSSLIFVPISHAQAGYIFSKQSLETIAKPIVGHLNVVKLFWTLSSFAHFQCTLQKYYRPEAHKQLTCI